jgi:hypothetical protein
VSLLAVAGLNHDKGNFSTSVSIRMTSGPFPAHGEWHSL